MLPWLSFPRYMMAKVEVKNLVLIPIMALIHIQNTAPGPPMEMATATPAIFPIPMVEDKAVVKAWKCVISPESFGLSYLPRNTCKAWPRYLKGKNLERISKYKPPPISRNSKGKPQA